MAPQEINCSQCGASEYQIVDQTTAEVICLFCRNRWVVPSLKFDEEKEEFRKQAIERGKKLDAIAEEEEAVERWKGRATLIGLAICVVVMLFFWISPFIPASCYHEPRAKDTSARIVYISQPDAEGVVTLEIIFSVSDYDRDASLRSTSNDYRVRMAYQVPADASPGYLVKDGYVLISYNYYNPNQIMEVHSRVEQTN